MPMDPIDRHDLVLAFDLFLKAQHLDAADFLIELGAEWRAQAQNEDTVLVKDCLETASDYLQDAAMDWYVSHRLERV